MNLALFHDHPSSAALAARFAEDQILSKLEATDRRARRKGLDALDGSKSPLIRIGMEISPEGRVTKNGYGVFHLAWLARQHPEWPSTVRAELEEIRARIRSTHGRSLRFLIWAGMGGSAEDKSAYAAAGLLDHGPRCYVVDSTDPAKLAAVLADITRRTRGSLADALRSTLVVGMAMGMTSYEPVVNLEKLAKLYDRHEIDSRPNFVYMTLAGSLLDQFASARGYRRVELQLDGGNSTAGRHSAPLTRGSLYPLGLAGVDLDAWVRGTDLDEQDIHTAWSLASFLEQQSGAGRDKVTLLTAPSLEPAALWTKQNFEESLGKSEAQGIKIVIGEKLHLPNYRLAGDARQDRVFLVVGRRGEAALERARLAALKRAGYPTAVLTLPPEKSAPLSRYMQFIHYVVFGLAWLRRMNFVTQPSVELYKAITNPLYQNSIFQGGIENTAEWTQFHSSPRQKKFRGGVTLHYDRLPCGFDPGDRDAAEAYAALLTQFASTRVVEYGELTFFGDMRYSRSGRAMRRLLDRAAEEVFRAGMKMPVDVYEGPAMNHSYHEMVIGHGKAFSTVLLSEQAAALPEAGYTSDYHRAQFLATQMALEQRGRLVVALTVADLEAGSLKALKDFFHAVAAHL